MPDLQDGDDPKENGCQKACQSRLCLCMMLLGMAAGIAVSIVVVLLSDSVRNRFPPDQKWWQKSIVYEIYPRSFQDSDDNGVGDLEGITSKLDYFTYIHVDAVWISPFYPSPMKDFGYDIKNYTDVDPLFGTLEDFDDLLQKAHDKDIRVIIDFVAGHTSSEHPWFISSEQRTAPYEDYYIWANGTTLPNGTVVEPSNWMSAFGYSAWQWSAVRKQYYYHAFLPQQPTLNYRNPVVVDEMKNVLRFWLDRGVDGIRVDAVTHIMVSKDYHQDQALSNTPGTEWWQAEHYINNLTNNLPGIQDIVKGWREVLDSYEDSSSSDDDDDDNSKFLVVELYDKPNVRSRYYESGADIPFNFDLVSSLSSTVNDCDATCIRDVILSEYDSLNGTDFWPNFVFSNHDNHRVASRMGEVYVDVLNMLLLTLRGTPTVYYGEEIGMEDINVSFQDTQDPLGITYGSTRYMEVSRDPERSPMQWSDDSNAGFTNVSKPWLPVNGDYPTINVKHERYSSDVTSLKVFREIAILRDEPAFRYGFFQFTDVTPSILSYVRSAHGYPRFLVVLNLGNTTVTHDFSGSVKENEGHIKVVTSNAANGGRYKKSASVSLTQLSLNAGDGLIIQLSTMS